ncbi:MAG: amidohydrolase family protein [Anaerolineae bacterium]|nr:amidohydrolase family protein [Anaerolineae bacterium]
MAGVQQIDTLLVDAMVVTMNDAFDIFPDGAVAIRGDSIVDVGPAQDLTAKYRAAETVACGGRVVTPGLVNAHTHTPMTLLRGLASDRRLDVWLMGYMMPVEREFVSPEFCRLGAQLACAEMIRGGVTAFADMYYFEEEVARATAEAGMRGVLGETILKFPSPDADSYEDALAYTRGYIERWLGHPLIVPAVAPHAPYTATPELLRACAELALEFDVPVLTHIAETRQEVEDNRRANNMPVVPWVKKQGLLDAKVLAAHCVHLDHGEIHTFKNHGTTVVHCPTSNLKLASGIAPIAEMLAHGLTVGVGTDGPASNNNLDMFEEMHLAAILAKGATADPTVLPARQVFNMATRMGAQAMFIDHLTGALEPGKRADLAVIDLSALHNWPRFTMDADGVYAQLVYAAQSGDVTDVMCNGRWLMRDRALLTLDEAALRAAAAEVAGRIDQFLIAREGDLLSKLVAIGGLEREESFEIQVKSRLDGPERVRRLLDHPDTVVVRHSHYRQYDTYFLFGDRTQGRVRYREDNFINPPGDVPIVRSRLTFTDEGKEREFSDAIMLSRSRFIAPASHSRRFYREYFRPDCERELQKERRRWHIDYKGRRFYINVDTFILPPLPGTFLEIKSRTWSKNDAEEKAGLVSEMLNILGVDRAQLFHEEYVNFAQDERADAPAEGG